MDPRLNPVSPTSPTLSRQRPDPGTPHIFSFNAFMPVQRPRNRPESAPQLPALDIFKRSNPRPSRLSTLPLSAADLTPATSTTPSVSDLQPTIPPPARAVPIPKAITDRLINQQSRIEELERTVLKNEETIQTLEASHSDLRSQFDDLDNENTGLMKRMDLAEERAAVASKTIDRLFEILENMPSNLPPDEEADIKPKPPRDNVFNTAVRKTFFVAMGLSKKSKLRDAASIRSTRSGGGFIKDRETGGQLLRPDWSVSFAENSSWHNRMVEFIRQKASLQNPVITSTFMDAKSADDLLQRLATVFKNIKEEAKKVAKSGVDGDDEDQVDTQKQDGRRKTRKVRKCNERIEVLEDAGMTLPEEFTFFLQPIYQSTDESDASDVLDPNTDTEESAEVPAQSTRKPWKSRTPLYRSDEFHEGVLKIDVLLMKSRKDYVNNNKGKTAAHPRVRGEWKDVPLPFIGTAKLNKIPRSAIDAEWLANHSGDDTPSRILEVGSAASATADDKGMFTNNGEEDVE
ncbi:hypothetical protein DFH09DRAFT_1339703 [Mycena vulgaris]|nr:hypothetical protein DFH09DRAFT_1339703 [Mycena vulgaris]